MALRELSEQVQLVENALVLAQMYPTSESVGLAHAQYKKLRVMLDGLASFIRHDWKVTLLTNKQERITFPLRAENLEHAKDMVAELIDENDDVIGFELYCDGIRIPEEELY